MYNFTLKAAVCAGGISQQSAASVVLLPRSLLAFCDQAYTNCLHGIDSVSAR